VFGVNIPTKAFHYGSCYPSIGHSFGKKNALMNPGVSSFSSCNVLLSTSEKINSNEQESQGDPSQIKPNLQKRKTHESDVKNLRARTNHLLFITSPNYNSESADANKKKMRVNRYTFHWLMDSWAFSGQRDAPSKALSLLRRMEDLASTHHVAPNLDSYAKLIHVYTRSGKKNAGTKAHSILQELQHTPNEFIYTSVLEAYASSGASDAGLKAENLCYEMQHEYEINPDLDIKPTARSYNAVINAWARSKDEDGARKAEDFLYAMEEMYASKGYKGLCAKPNTINYNSLINAWAGSRKYGAAEKAEHILRRMEDLHHNGDTEVKPDVISFNSCMDAWAKSEVERAGQRAEDLFNRMEKLYKSGENLDVKPNTRSYNSMMNAYAKSGHYDAALIAQNILEKMEKLYEKGNNDVKPDLFSFATVINAWGRSNESGKADRILEIFNYMEKWYKKGNESVRPNVVIFNAAINACAYTIGDIAEQRRATEITNTLFKKLEQSSYGHPDQVTYGTFLKVCHQQMPSDDIRDQLINIIFKKCAKDGQVGKLVLDQLKFMTTEEQFKNLVGISMYDCSYWDIPGSWRQNVVEGKRRRRQQLF